MTDQFFKFLSEALPSLTEDDLSQRWETHTQVPWSSLPTEAKLKWAQVGTLARVSAAWEDLETAWTMIRTLQR